MNRFTMKYPYQIRIFSNDSWQHFEQESNFRRARKTALSLVKDGHVEESMLSYYEEHENGTSLYKPLRKYIRLESGKIAKCATQNRMMKYLDI